MRRIRAFPDRVLPVALIAMAASAGGACAATETIVEKTLFKHDSAPEGIYRWSEGTILPLDDKGHLMMLVSAFGHGGHDNSTATILEFHSRDGGLTWTNVDEAKVFQGNIGKQNVMSPALLRLDDGDILCFFMVKNSLEDCGPWMRRSTDNGKTWSEPERLPYVGYGGLANDHAIQLSTGRVLVPCWLSMDKLGSTHAYCMLSDDRGRTWKKTELITTPKGSTGRKTDPAAEEPAVVELKDGRLMMFMRTYLGSYYVSYSDDKGTTWSEPVDSGVPAPGAMPMLRRMPTGDLLLIFNYGAPDKISGPWPRSQLASLVSRDEGKSWTSLRLLDGAPDFTGKITMANACFVGEDRAVVTYSKSMTKKNAYSWRLQVLPLRWFYEGDTDVVFGQPYLAKAKAKTRASAEARKNALARLGKIAEADRKAETLVAAYHFEEGEEADIVDTSSNGNDGALVATPEGKALPKRVKGHDGQGLAFEVGTGAVEVPDSPSLRIPSHKITLEAWIKPTKTKKFATIATKEGLYEFAVNHGRLQAAVKVGGHWEWFGSTKVSVDAWSHVAFTYDGVALRFFLGGEMVEQAPRFGRMDSGGGPFCIGWNPGIGDSEFVGVIDEVKVWREVRHGPTAAAKPSGPRKVGTTHQLFLDDALIDSTENVRRVVHQPRKHPENPVLTYDKPWEGNCVLLWGSVLWDEQEDRFRMWYQTYQKFGRPGESTLVCYATSEDGIHWDKPSLGLIDYRGSKDNNIVLAPEPDRTIDSPTVFRDPNGGNRMYFHQKEGVRTAVSPDGLRWTWRPVVVKAGDRNTAYYDAARKRYRVITRIPGRGLRTCGLWESKDGEWFDAVGEILAPDKNDPPKTEFYGMIEFPYAGVHVGFLEMFFVPTRRLNTQLTYSRDGLHWHRACERQTFLDCGPPGSWDYAWVTPSHNPPIRRGDKLYIFYQGRKTLHWAEKPYGHIGAIGLAFLRVDGFASMDALYEEGTVTTCPLLIEGKRLHVNAAARPGFVAVEVLDQDGKPVPGLTRKDCRAMAMEDSIDRAMEWTSGKDLGAVAGESVRLRFVLQGAQLYSFWVGR